MSNLNRILLGVFSLLIIVLLVEIIYYFFVFSKTQKINTILNSPTITKEISPNEQKLPTNEEEAKIIQDYIKDYPAEYKNWVFDSFTEILKNVNIKRTSLNKKPLNVVQISSINLIDLFTLIKSQSKDYMIIDLRDEYEKQFAQIPQSPQVSNIRFGDLINDISLPSNKNQSIILICNSGARSFISANYLNTLGYTDVKALKGGIVLWAITTKSSKAVQLLVNKPFKQINEVLQFRPKNNANENMLQFGPIGDEKINVQTMNTSELDSYINLLSKDKTYILQCSNFLYCWDAVVFWSRAHSYINITGYTGFQVNPT